jgi:hypothetical protein
MMKVIVSILIYCGEKIALPEISRSCEKFALATRLRAVRNSFELSPICMAIALYKRISSTC